MGVDLGKSLISVEVRAEPFDGTVVIVLLRTGCRSGANLWCVALQWGGGRVTFCNFGSFGGRVNKV